METSRKKLPCWPRLARPRYCPYSFPSTYLCSFLLINSWVFWSSFQIGVSMLRSSSCFKFVCISLPIVISRPPTHLQLSISTTPPRYNTLDFLLLRFRFSRQLVLSLSFTRTCASYTKCVIICNFVRRNAHYLFYNHVSRLLISTPGLSVTSPIL
jgi:hypothetical protein